MCCHNIARGVDNCFCYRCRKVLSFFYFIDHLKLKKKTGRKRSVKEVNALVIRS